MNLFYTKFKGLFVNGLLRIFTFENFERFSLKEFDEGLRHNYGNIWFNCYGRIRIYDSENDVLMDDKGGVLIDFKLKSQVQIFVNENIEYSGNEAGGIGNAHVGVWGENVDITLSSYGCNYNHPRISNLEELRKFLSQKDYQLRVARIDN